MAEMRSLEEYVRGTEGDDEKALVGALRRACGEARTGGFERVQLEVRVTPTGEPSRQEATWSCKVEDDPRAVADRALELLTDSPGETFAGELRINFRAPGDSRAHFGSYTRKIRPVVLNAPGGGDDGDGGATVDVKALSAVVGLVERLARVAGDAVEKNVAMMNGSANLLGGASTLMVNHARATGRVVDAPAKPGGVPVIHDLLRGVLKVGEAAAGADSKVGKAAAAAGAALDVGAPAPDPDGSGGGAVPTLNREGGDGSDSTGDPAPEGAVTEAAAEAWARANPDKARAMALRLMQEG